MNKFFATWIGVFIASYTSVAFADKIYLQNGDILSGKVKNLTSSNVTFTPDFDKKIEIKLAQTEIKGLETEEELTVELKNGTTSKGLLKSDGAGQFTIKSGLMIPAKPVATANIKEAYTETPEEHHGIKTHGNFKGGLNATNGNSDTKVYDLSGRVVAETKKHRVTLVGEYGYTEEEENTVRDRSFGSSKYDYFIAKNIYSFANSDFERDKFQDLNLRAALGAGLGYQVYNKDYLHLNFEAGPNYVNEDYLGKDRDNNYAALRWSATYDQKLTDTLSIYHNHKIIQSLEDTNGILVNARTGFNVPIIEKVQAGFEWRIDWNNNPTLDNETLDQAYIANIGYFF